jgi:hypothetical protein
MDIPESELQAPRPGADASSPEAGSRVLLDPAAERQLQAARSRTASALSPRDRLVEYPLALGFLAATALLIALVPGEREFELLPTLALIAAYAFTARIKFEVASCYTVPTQLVLVPMLFLMPVVAVPLAVAAAVLLGEAPDLLRGRRSPERAVVAIADCWYLLGPVLVLAVAGEPGPALDQWPLLLAALAAQFAVDIAVNTPREWLELGSGPREQLAGAGWTFGIDALLSPIGLLAAAMAVESTYAFLLVLPLAALIGIFAGERRERLNAAFELSEAYRGTTMALAEVLDSDDEYTGNHSRMVVSLTRRVGERLGLTPERQRIAEFAALLHDIGKVAVPKEVINKPGPLSPSEWELIKLHTVKGQEILDRVGGMLAEVGGIVRSSHERWDGGGYPDGLSGDEIPIEARIISCCDAFNAMTTDRSYRKAMSTDAALAETRAHAGTQFDPAVAEVLIQLVTEWAAVNEPAPATESQRPSVAASPVATPATAPLGQLPTA